MNILLAFDSNKFAMYFTPITLFVFFVIICVILIVYNHKNRKNDAKNSKNYSKNDVLDENIVKTVYTNKGDNFSQTENFPVPENFSTKEFNFEFAGWDKFSVNENGRVTTQAIWIRKPKKYVVNIFGRDENTPIAVKEVDYGTSVDLINLMPEKEEDENFVYTFVGWDKVPTIIESDTDIHALFEVKTKDGEVISTPTFAENIENSESNSNNIVTSNEELQVITTFAEEANNDEESHNFDSLDNNEVIDITQTQESVIESKPQQIFDEKDDNYDENAFDDNEEIIESFDSEEEYLYTDLKTNDDVTLFNKIRVGKPAISHGVDTTVRSKNGYKIETSNSIYSAYSINVDNKSTSADNDDIFKRAGVGIRGVTPSNSSLSDSFDSSVSRSNGVSYQVNRTPQKESLNPNPEPVSEESEAEQFFKNTMLVNHRKTIKK